MTVRFLLILALSGAGWCQTAPPAPAPSSQPAMVTKAPPPAPVTFSNEQIKDLIRKSADNDIQNDLKQRDYTYVERSEMRSLDGHGQVKKVESETDDVMVIYGEQVGRKIARDDKPLSPKDAAKEDKKIQELIDKRKNESEEKRQKRLAKEAKDREESRQFVREIAEAYDFTFRGHEVVDGHDTYVIDCEPRPGFQPHLKDAKYLSKFRGRVWIEPEEFQVVKLDAEAIDNLSWGLFLARFHKGAHFILEQTRVNDEVWLPRRVQLTFDGKLALLKTLRMDIDVRYSDYKKFRSNTRILGVSELPAAAPADRQPPAPSASK